MTSLRNRLNIHGIVDLDQMAMVLTSLVEQVDRQNRTIADLRDSLSNYVTKDSFIERIGALEENVKRAWDKIHAVHEAATATAMGKRISAGDLSSSNFKHICHLTQLVMDCATKVELEVHKKELSNAQHNLSELRSDYDKSLGVMDGLSKSQYHQSERIGALEAAVAGKIDRAECDHLQSLVAKVLLYDAFKSDTVEALKRLHRFRDESLDRYTLYDGHLQELDEGVDKVREAVGRAATKQDAHQLARELRDLDERLALCASTTALSEARDELANTNARLAGCCGEVGALQQRATGLEEELGTKATIQALRECVLRRHYERAVEALGAEIERRAPQGQADRLGQRLQDLEARAAREEERVAVAMQFVEWFTSRGEGYEHNIRTLDKHLKSLVVAPTNPLGSVPGATVRVEGGGGVTLAGGSSSVHTCYLPGNRVAFQAQPSHAP